MNNFIFFKKRDFSSLISDTIDFFKIYFKDFAHNFIVINGILVLGFSVLVSVFLTQNLEIFKSFSAFMEYVSTPFWISLMIIVLLSMLLMVVINSFTVIYVKKASEFPLKKNFTSIEIFEEIKSFFPKILLFLFFSFFVLVIPYYLISVLFAFIPIINFVSSFILPAVFSIVWSLALFYYIFDRKAYFESISSSFEVLKVDFWQKVGASMVMYIIIYFAVLFIIILAAILTVVVAVSGFYENLTPLVAGILTAVFWSLVMVLIFIVSSTLSIMFMMMYFSENDKKIVQDDLDKIGMGNDDF